MTYCGAPLSSTGWASSDKSRFIYFSQFLRGFVEFITSSARSPCVVLINGSAFALRPLTCWEGGVSARLRAQARGRDPPRGKRSRVVLPVNELVSCFLGRSRNVCLPCTSQGCHGPTRSLLPLGKGAGNRFPAPATEAAGRLCWESTSGKGMLLMS